MSPEKRKLILLGGGGAVLLFLIVCYLLGGSKPAGDGGLTPIDIVLSETDPLHYQVPPGIAQSTLDDPTQMPDMQIIDVWESHKPSPDANPPTENAMPGSEPLVTVVEPAGSTDSSSPARVTKVVPADPPPRSDIAVVNPVGSGTSDAVESSPMRPVAPAAAGPPKVHAPQSSPSETSPAPQAVAVATAQPLPSDRPGSISTDPPEEPLRAVVVDDDETDTEVYEGLVPKAVQLDIVSPRLPRQGVVGHSRGLITAELFSLAIGKPQDALAGASSALTERSRNAALVRVTRPQAQSFASWLTRAHRAAMLITEGQSYRLPTREEAASPQIWHDDETPHQQDEARPFGVVLVEDALPPARSLDQPPRLDARLPAALPVAPAISTDQGIPLRTDLADDVSPLQKSGPDKPLWQRPEQKTRPQ